MKCAILIALLSYANFINARYAEGSGNGDESTSSTTTTTSTSGGQALDSNDPRSDGSGGWSSGAYSGDTSAYDQGYNNQDSWTSEEQETYVDNGGYIDNDSRSGSDLSLSNSTSDDRDSSSGSNTSSSTTSSITSSNYPSPWSNPEETEFGSASNYMAHENAIQGAIRRANETCTNCGKFDRAVVINRVYYKNLQDSNDHNLPTGPMQSMRRYNSPTNNFYQTDEFDVNLMRRIDRSVREGKVSVIMPGQLTSSSLVSEGHLTPIQKLAARNTPIIIGTAENIEQTTGVDNVVGYYSNNVGGRGGAIFIGSNQTVANNIPAANLYSTHYRVLKHELFHSGQGAIIQSYEDMFSNGSLVKLSRSDRNDLENAYNIAINHHYENEEIDPSLFGEAGETLSREGNSYIRSYSEIFAHLSEGDGTVESLAVGITKSSNLNYDEALSVARALRNSEVIHKEVRSLHRGANLLRRSGF